MSTLNKTDMSLMFRTHFDQFIILQVIVADNYFTGSKENLKKWIGHPRFELIRHGIRLKTHILLFYVNMIVIHLAFGI